MAFLEKTRRLLASSYTLLERSSSTIILYLSQLLSLFLFSHLILFTSFLEFFPHLLRENRFLSSISSSTVVMYRFSIHRTIIYRRLLPTQLRPFGDGARIRALACKVSFCRLRRASDREARSKESKFARAGP